MINRLILTLICISSGLIILYSGVIIADDMPEDIVIDNRDYPSDRKGPVEFSHLIHNEDYEVECDQCHHEYEDGENVWEEDDPVKKCSECHSPVKNQDNIKNLRLSFHRNCKNCHKDLAKEGISEDAPYRKCAGCHELE